MRGGGSVGIGFAIPSNMARTLAQQLIDFGEIKRGLLGIKGTEMSADIAKAFNLDVQRGAFVSEVLRVLARQKRVSKRAILLPASTANR